ncbi:hypothetical protein [Plasmodium yoelii yoelii]|uniref:Uncharacterized protein n=1 Tax=Plasmodium yoelii yoelii TaxID=73239 RepID=Q7RKI5_PLAYO|nr:hypothetical protein [Plasmodium yoelii yoelii]
MTKYDDDNNELTLFAISDDSVLIFFFIFVAPHNYKIKSDIIIIYLLHMFIIVI